MCCRALIEPLRAPTRVYDFFSEKSSKIIVISSDDLTNE